MKVKDIEPFYTDDLKCSCGEKLHFTAYDRFSDEKGDHFIVKRFFCNKCRKPVWVEPEEKERIYLDGEKAVTLKELDSIILSLSNLSSDMQRVEKASMEWGLTKDYWGFREEFSDDIKAKYRILYEYNESRKVTA